MKRKGVSNNSKKITRGSNSSNGFKKERLTKAMKNLQLDKRNMKKGGRGNINMICC
ncbi:hypothetical protein OXYTRIMIC_695 [Oxytricha trifallax]|uniref:Uncharacterized protein n=1 Tax=Oxytricha trifallax TaxID=1172189 RepID=A0A073HXK1_9SPIT|nr:hypothetical protein OXYTRIMIC_695 [Oxytricha trifallax]